MDRGTFTGTVSDTTGGTVPNARITIRNTATGAVADVTTNESGQYARPNLPIGPYQITVDADGFKRFVRSELNLGVAETLRVDVQLTVGSTSETVEVNAELPKVNTDSPMVETSLASKSLTTLPLGCSTYHALQVTMNREFSKGLSLYANYVWSKTMSNVDSSLIGDNDGPLDYYNLGLEKTIAEYDIPHMFKAYASYDLPVGRGKKLLGNSPRAVDAVIGGWSFSTILNYFSGTPMQFSASGAGGGWNGATNRANISPGDLVIGGFDKSKFELSSAQSPNNRYLNRSKFADALPLTLGTAAKRYSQARGFGTINENLVLTKSQPITEKIRFQLRAEFLNAFNRHQLGGISTSVTNINFGQVTTVSGNRQVQLSARIEF